MLSRLKFDIADLIEDILNDIPVERFESDTSTFGDVAMGGGQMIAAVEQRLRAYGHSNENIASRVFGFSDKQIEINFARHKYKLIAKLTKASREEANSMDFDVRLTNPPYQDNTKGDSKRWPLWHKFLEEALESNASDIAFIVPASLCSPGKLWERVKPFVKSLNLDAKTHFKGVGSTFCYVVLDPKGSKSMEITSRSKKYTLPTDVPFVPPVVNEATMEMMHTLLSRSPRKWQMPTRYHHSKDYVTKDKGKFKVYHTNAQTLWTNVDHESRTDIKVAVTLSGNPIFTVLDDSFTSEIVPFTTFDSIEEAHSFAEECNGEFVQTLLATFKWSGWNSRKVIEML
jgi:hypothetical protein